MFLCEHFYSYIHDLVTYKDWPASFWYFSSYDYRTLIMVEDMDKLLLVKVQNLIEFIFLIIIISQVCFVTGCESWWYLSFGSGSNSSKSNGGAEWKPCIPPCLAVKGHLLNMLRLLLCCFFSFVNFLNTFFKSINTIQMDWLTCWFVNS